MLSISSIEMVTVSLLVFAFFYPVGKAYPAYPVILLFQNLLIFSSLHKKITRWAG